MHFFKTFVSTLLIAAPMAMAAPSADNSVGQSETPELDSAIKQLVDLVGAQDDAEVEARDLEARSGWTCAFLGGNKGCQIKVCRPPTCLLLLQQILINHYSVLPWARAVATAARPSKIHSSPAPGSFTIT